MPFVKSDLQGHTILCGDNWFQPITKDINQAKDKVEGNHDNLHGATNRLCIWRIRQL